MSTVIESHYQPQTTTPEVKFALTNVPPPSNLYVGREDRLSITTFNSAAGLTLEVHTRILLPNGIVVPGVQAHVPNSNRTAATTGIPLAEGFLLSVLVVVAGGTAKRGQCYVVVSLARGDNASPINHVAVIQGYVATSITQGWPGNRLEQPSDGRGYIRDITGTTPAAGAEISETVPTGARWSILGIALQLATAVAVANRGVRIYFVDGGGGFTYWESTVVVTQAASLTNQYYFGPGTVFTAPTLGAKYTNALPISLIMKAADAWATDTVAIQAADQYSAIHYHVEEWIEP